MSIHPTDPGVAAALAEALGHPGPFSAAECAALAGPLTVVHARDISELRGCTGLRRLELVACEVRSLEPLTALTGLQELTVVATPIEELAPLRALPELSALTLNFTHVTDAAPLVGLPALARAELVGNPWTEASYRQTLAQVAGTPSAATGRPPALLLSGDEDWSTTREMWERGLAASVGRLDFQDWYLVRAGVPQRTPGPCEAALTDPFLIWQALEEDPALTLEQLFDKFLKHREEPPRIEGSRLRSRRIWGSSAEAAEWVEASALDAETRALLLRFVARFPTLSFYRETPAFLDEVEAAAGVKLPGWLREVRQTLAWVVPGEQERDVQVRFRQFERGGHGGSDPTRWYSVAPMNPSGEAPPRYMSLGFADDPLASQLLVRKTGKETVIYDFAEEMYRDLKLEGASTKGALGPVFTSYAAMLAAIEAVRVREGEPVVAREEA